MKGKTFSKYYGALRCCSFGVSGVKASFRLFCRSVNKEISKW